MTSDYLFKGSGKARVIKRWGHPKKGELYWNSEKRRVLEAKKDLDSLHLVVEREVSE